MLLEGLGLVHYLCWFLHITNTISPQLTHNSDSHFHGRMCFAYGFYQGFVSLARWNRGFFGFGGATGSSSVPFCWHRPAILPLRAVCSRTNRWQGALKLPRGVVFARCGTNRAAIGRGSRHVAPDSSRFQVEGCGSGVVMVMRREQCRGGK